MAYQKNLQVPYHQQDTGYYCGAASAQVVLNSTGVGGPLEGQATLYADNHSHSRDESTLTPKVYWATAPDGLTWTLNDRRPAGFTNPFVEFALSSEDQVSRKIAWTIEHYDVAPCALVYGVQHWIVVTGMTLSAAPATSDDTSYTITNFRVNNPWPPVPSSAYWPNPAQPPPPPHGGADGCGSGGTLGIADELVSHTSWKANYMSGNYGAYPATGHWYGKYTAVCDPDPPPMRQGPSLARERRFDGDRIIGAEETHRLFAETLEQGTFALDKRWETAFHGAEPGEPIVVQRLDRRNEFYTILPVASGDGAQAAVAFDARFGDFQQAAIFPEPDRNLSRPITADRALALAVERPLELDRYDGYRHLREETAAVLPVFVWKPCRESLSPFWPFRMVTSAAGTVYVRADGETFATLHDDEYGI